MNRSMVAIFWDEISVPHRRGDEPEMQEAAVIRP